MSSILDPIGGPLTTAAVQIPNEHRPVIREVKKLLRDNKYTGGIWPDEDIYEVLTNTQPPFSAMAAFSYILDAHAHIVANRKPELWHEVSKKQGHKKSDDNTTYETARGQTGRRGGRGGARGGANAANGRGVQREQKKKTENTQTPSPEESPKSEEPRNGSEKSGESRRGGRGGRGRAQTTRGDASSETSAESAPAETTSRRGRGRDTQSGERRERKEQKDKVVYPTQVTPFQQSPPGSWAAKVRGLQPVEPAPTPAPEVSAKPAPRKTPVASSEPAPAVEAAPQVPDVQSTSHPEPFSVSSAQSAPASSDVSSKAPAEEQPAPKKTRQTKAKEPRATAWQVKQPQSAPAEDVAAASAAAATPASSVTAPSTSAATVPAQTAPTPSARFSVIRPSVKPTGPLVNVPASFGYGIQADVDVGFGNPGGVPAESTPAAIAAPAPAQAQAPAPVAAAPTASAPVATPAISAMANPTPVSQPQQATAVLPSMPAHIGPHAPSMLYPGVHPSLQQPPVSSYSRYAIPPGMQQGYPQQAPSHSNPAGRQSEQINDNERSGKGSAGRAPTMPSHLPPSFPAGYYNPSLPIGYPMQIGLTSAYSGAYEHHEMPQMPPFYDNGPMPYSMPSENSQEDSKNGNDSSSLRSDVGPEWESHLTSASTAASMSMGVAGYYPPPISAPPGYYPPPHYPYPASFHQGYPPAGPAAGRAGPLPPMGFQPPFMGFPRPYGVSSSVDDDSHHGPVGLDYQSQGRALDSSSQTNGPKAPQHSGNYNAQLMPEVPSKPQAANSHAVGHADFSPYGYSGYSAHGPAFQFGGGFPIPSHQYSAEQRRTPSSTGNQS